MKTKKERMQTKHLFSFIFVMMIISFFIFSLFIIFHKKNNIYRKYETLVLNKSISSRNYFFYFYKEYVDKLFLLKDNLAFNDFFDAQEKQDVKSGSFWSKRIIDDLTTMISISKNIYKIRYINNSGQELVKISSDSGRIIIAESDKLDDISNSYYFNEMKHIKNNEIYVSNIDLMEGTSASTLKPNIRIAAPVFDKKENKQGFIILNIDIRNFFETRISC